MNEREKKQASLPISVFGIALVSPLYLINLFEKSCVCFAKDAHL